MKFINSKFCISGLSALVLCLSLNSCDYKSLKGEPVNQYADQGLSNSYEKYGEFPNYAVYNEEYKPKKDGGAIVPALALSNQEFVYATTAGSVLLIAKELMWEKHLDNGEVVNANMAADKEQNIYCVSNTGKIYSYNFNGAIRWKFKLCDTLPLMDVPCNLICLDDGLIAGISDGTIYKLSFDGKPIWKTKMPTGISRSIASADQSLFFVQNGAGMNDSDTLTSLDSRGNVKWKKAPGYRLPKAPGANDKAIALSGIKYENNDAYNMILSYKLDGSEIWRKEIGYSPKFLSIANNGEVLVNAFQNGIAEQTSAIYRFSPSGALIWKKHFNYSIPSPILISNSMLAFLGVTYNTVGLYYLNRDSGEIQTILSLSDEDPIIQTPTVRPDGAISFAYFQKVGFVRGDEPWLNKALPW
jgi:outer membrane protein assembly factor BamB